MIALCTTALWYYHSVSGLTSSYSRGPGPDKARLLLESLAFELCLIFFAMSSLQETMFQPLALDHALLNPNPGDIVEQASSRQT